MTQFQRQAINMTLGQLATNEVMDERILKIMVDVPRENFVPVALRQSAYVDENIEISKDRFLLAPMTFARLLEIAAPTPSCRVLVIGGGNGYAVAALSILAGHVVSIESDSNLVAQAMDKLRKMGIKDVDIKHAANMSYGCQVSAPYDVIFINGGVEDISEDLTSQLAIGGRLVAIRNVAPGLGKGVIAQRFGGIVNIRECFDAYAELLPDFQNKAKFVF